MQKYTFYLNISYQDFLHHYTGIASNVILYTDQGLSLQLPAVKFRPFLNHLGVRGRFCLVTDKNNRLVRLEKIT